MASEDNKATTRRIPEEVLNQQKLDVVDEILAEDFVNHLTMPGIPNDREGAKMLFGALFRAFPDLHVTVEQEIAEGDTVVTYNTSSGTQEGEMFGMPATGKRATWNEIHIGRLKDGKVAEHWGLIDLASIMVQLGHAPAPPGPPPQ
jgi:steroid delta-isomerase-like uncharacterized protein